MKSLNADVPWAEIAGIGNVLRHDYQPVEPLIIRNIVQAHLDLLEQVILLNRKRLS